MATRRMILGEQTLSELGIIVLYFNADGNKTYGGIYPNTKAALDYAEGKYGEPCLVLADEEELEKAIIEDGMSSDLSDIFETLRVLSGKMYKIESKRVHEYYDKMSKEFCRLHLKKKPEEKLIRLKNCIENGDLSYDNKIELDGISLTDVDILSVIYDLLEIED